MTDKLQEIFRTYSWSYFNQHSEQRLKTFNFYILLCTVIIGAIATFMSKDNSLPHLTVVPLTLPIFSFIFWKLDQRTKMLIGNAEQALKYLDDIALNDAPDNAQVLALFKQDDLKIEKLDLYPLLDGYFSYTRSFNWIFIIMSVIGITATLKYF